VAIPPGSYKLGPENGKLLVKTGREGMGGKMGHDLVIEVGRWSATADVGEDFSACSLTASAEVGSMEVVSGEGGVKPLSDGDKGEIKKTIIDKILGNTTIDFKSTSISGGGSNATVQGDLTIAGKTSPAQFQLQDLGGGGSAGGGELSPPLVDQRQRLEDRVVDLAGERLPFLQAGGVRLLPERRPHRILDRLGGAVDKAGEAADHEADEKVPDRGVAQGRHVGALQQRQGGFVEQPGEGEGDGEDPRRQQAATGPPRQGPGRGRADRVVGGERRARVDGAGAGSEPGDEDEAGSEGQVDAELDGVQALPPGDPGVPADRPAAIPATTAENP